MSLPQVPKWDQPISPIFSDTDIPYYGINTRDWMATQMMAALVAKYGYVDWSQAEELAEGAYDMADALLAESETLPEPKATAMPQSTIAPPDESWTIRGEDL